MKHVYYLIAILWICLTASACMGGKRPRTTVNNIAQPTVSVPTEVDKENQSVEEVSHVVTPRNLEIPISLNAPREQIILHHGYTVSYSPSSKLPNWVAYELTYEEVQGTVPRAKKFTQDPDVRGAQADNEDYRNSGWDKGHMCPAGDMKWSKQAMNESFYFTNICPQNPNLNGGDWKDLEEKCRALTQYYGKIYIVCGAIVGQAVNGTIGYNRVVIPDAFYKVLLVETSKGYESIGFYFENKAGHRNLSYYAKSVDDIERLANIDFFAALADNEESEVESKYNINVWQIR